MKRVSCIRNRQKRIRVPVRKEYKKGDEGKKIYKRWRKKIYRRDEFTCRLCRKKKAYLNAHHIKKKAWFPTLGYKLSNGITLCKSCHKIVTNREEIFEDILKEILKNKIVAKSQILFLLESHREIDKRWMVSTIKELKGEI